VPKPGTNHNKRETSEQFVNRVAEEMKKEVARLDQEVIDAQAKAERLRDVIKELQR